MNKIYYVLYIVMSLYLFYYMLPFSGEKKERYYCISRRNPGLDGGWGEWVGVKGNIYSLLFKTMNSGIRNGRSFNLSTNDTFFFHTGQSITRIISMRMVKRTAFPTHTITRRRFKRLMVEKEASIR